MENSYIEFEITDNNRLIKLVTVFEALQIAKQENSFSNDEYWLKFFDDESRQYFWWLTEEDLKEFTHQYFSTPLPQRLTDSNRKRPWDFGSMIDAFRDGEYELVNCKKIADNKGRFEFTPHSDPSGGTDCMKALIESFGFKITAEVT